MIIYCLLAFALIWIIVIFKFSLIDNNILANSSTNILSAPGGQLLTFHSNNNYQQHIITNVKGHEYHTKKVALPSHHSDEKFIASNNKQPLPLISEWLFIRSNPDYEIETPQLLHRNAGIKVNNDIQVVSQSLQEIKKSNSNDKIVLKINKNTQLAVESNKKASELTWPAVRKDGTIPDEDGRDKMPLIDISVPRFWFPPEGTDYNIVGRKVNGEETIFLMIASYRDFQCRETIASAFDRADHPERLFVGAVDQVVPGDIGCLDVEIPCSEKPDQALCKYRDQIAVYTMDAQYATGPVTARHIGDRMYRGEYFVMQMDAHCYFVRHWDTLLIDQWRSTGNEMAVLSSYLTDVQGSISPAGDSLRKTRPIQCNSDFEGRMPARYLRHGSQPEGMATIKDMPQLQPYWAAGFSFSRGHFKLRVPYDAYQPMVFQGEEIAIGIRGFTHGYDFYAPKDSVVFHEYSVKSKRRKKVHMFWENNKHAGMGQKSLKRATSVIHMAPDIKDDEWDHSELERYGLGNVRDVDLFYKLFLINREERQATQLCPFVKSGIMHRDFTPYIREDKLGIDYTALTNYDTKTVLENHLLSQHPYWKKAIEDGIARKDKGGLQYALNNAKRVGLDKKNPAIVKAGEEVLKSIKK